LIEKLFIKIKPLFVIKHPKFTSPSCDSELTVMNLNWWNPFHDSSELRYKGVDKLFFPNNNEAWRSKGRYLTVVSEYPFKPTFIILTINNIKNPPNNRLYIYGISAYD
jgi:hypothetical protein